MSNSHVHRPEAEVEWTILYEFDDDDGECNIEVGSEWGLIGGFDQVLDDMKYLNDARAVVELNIVGEGRRQDALALIAGPKEHDAKNKLVGVTMRCEPSNPYDANALRTEVMGQHVAYVAKGQAACLSPLVRRTCGGVLEASGLIVGGWKNRRGEGHFGIRVWLHQRDVARVGSWAPPTADQRVG